jgi:glycosyltransferase involved in cell wall biosynthesis
MTRVSVAMATYNGARYLGEQLASIAQQTLKPCELIICDDGSTDDTLAVAEAFASIAPFPVQVLRNDMRLHFRANFMKCARLCRGELIAFCDQDDVWRTDKLALVSDAFEDEEVVLVYHNARIFSAAQGVQGLVFDAARPSGVDAPLSRTPFDMPPGLTQTFRRCLLPLSDLRENTLDYWSEGVELAHDQWIHLLASSLGKVVYLAETLADYRQHENNLYGMKIRTPTLWQRLIGRLNRFSDYRHMEPAFGAIARVFAAAAGYPIDPGLARRAAQAAAWYQALSTAYGDRTEAYSAGSPAARAAAWGRLYRSRRYGPNGPFFFADQGFVRDFVHGVCLGRLRNPRPGISLVDHSLRFVPIEGSLEVP